MLLKIYFTCDHFVKLCIKGLKRKKKFNFANKTLTAFRGSNLEPVLLGCLLILFEYLFFLFFLLFVVFPLWDTSIINIIISVTVRCVTVFFVIVAYANIVVVVTWLTVLLFFVFLLLFFFCVGEGSNSNNLALTWRWNNIVWTLKRRQSVEKTLQQRRSDVVCRLANSFNNLHLRFRSKGRYFVLYIRMSLPPFFLWALKTASIS